MSDDLTARILVALERLETGQNTLRGDLIMLRGDLMARMDRLQDSITAQREGEIVNFGAAERAETIAKGAQDEVRIIGDQVNALVRQVRRLESEVRSMKGEP